MKAVRTSSDGVEVVDVPEPSGDGVLVEVRACGICGTDLHLLDAGGLGDTIVGHEIAGVTEDGRAVAVEPLITCGGCPACARGDRGLCDDPGPAIIGIAVDGGMAERVRVPAELVVPLPSGIELADASLVEPLAVAVRALGRVGLTSGDRVAVVGGGSIGLAAVAVARSIGATVELIARHDHQRVAGERLGALEPTEQPCSVVVEAAGTASALADAVARCAPGGRISVPGTYWDPVELPGMALGLKEATIVPSMMYGRTAQPFDFEVAAAALAADPEIPRAMISHRFPLDGAPDAFAAAADRAQGAIKVVVEPGG